MSIPVALFLVFCIDNVVYCCGVACIFNVVTALVVVLIAADASFAVNEPVTNNDPVICVLLLIDTIEPSSDILESPICSSFNDFIIRLVVGWVSAPCALYVSGPINNNDDVNGPDPAWWTNIHSSWSELNNNEPERCGLDPESITAIPPNFILGDTVLTVIKLSAIFNWDDVIYCIDADPNNIKSFVTVNDPVIMVLPFTSNFAFGVVVPIPKLPPTSILALSTLFWLKYTAWLLKDPIQVPPPSDAIYVLTPTPDCIFIAVDVELVKSIFPITDNLEVGAVVPMPTLPDADTTNWLNPTIKG